MSMTSTPTKGYVVPLTDFVEAFKYGRAKMADDKRAAADTVIAAACEDDVSIESLDNLPGDPWGVLGIPVPDGLYYADSDCDDIGDLEDGTWYVLYSDSDLYVRQNTHEHLVLMQLGIEPKEACWAPFG